MTWQQLLDILKNMETIKHTCLDKQVCINEDTGLYPLTIAEDLISGDVYLVNINVRDE